jgi:hypothetical protein
MSSELLFLMGALVFVGLLFRTLAGNKANLPPTKCAALVMEGKADFTHVCTVAKTLGDIMKRQAGRLNRPLLFLRVCGDFYDDFYPIKPPNPNLSAKARANALMAACIQHYKQIRERRIHASGNAQLVAFCEGVGFCLATFRRVSEIIPDMVPLLNSLDPKPVYEDRDSYAVYYREIGRLTPIPQGFIETSLTLRLSCFVSRHSENAAMDFSGTAMTDDPLLITRDPLPPEDIVVGGAGEDEQDFSGEVTSFFFEEDEPDTPSAIPQAPAPRDNGPNL